MNVLVLLSSWNGAAYIGEQVYSILNQQIDGDLHLLIRDDGSEDETVAIIERIGDQRMEVIRGERLGAKGSFLSLLDMARDRDAEFIALADQDDVWLRTKLTRATELLARHEGPAIYGSALNLVDRHLRPLGTYTFADRPHFEGAIFANCMTGCTCVFNRRFLTLLEHLPAAKEILMHDWWLYLVGMAFGTVIYDAESHILYRQHSSNQVGLSRGGVGAFVHRLQRFVRRAPGANRLSQAREFLRIYRGRVTVAQERYLDALIACEHRPMDRLRFAMLQRPHRRESLEEIGCFTKCAMGWF